MKTTRKLLALVLAMAMIMAMAISVSAAPPTGTIKVTNRQESQTYTAYKVFDLEYNESTGAYSYVLPSGWTEADFDAYVATINGTELKMADYFDTTAAFGKVYVTAKYSSTGSLVAGKLVNEYLKNKGVTGTQIPAEGLADQALGFYLMTSSLGNTYALGTLVPSTVGGTATLSLKEKSTPGDLPQIEKTYADGTTTGSFNIGDTVSFKIIVTVEEGSKEYTVHDKYTDLNVALNKDNIKVEPENNTAGAQIEDYTISEATDGCSFHITFKTDKAMNANDTIKITYSATVTGNDPTNLASLDGVPGSDDPGTGNTTYNFTLTKTDKDTAAELSGAEFVLYKVDNGVNKYATFGTEGNISGWVDSIGEAGKLQVGTVTTKKLAAGTYYLQETKAPDGYVAISDPIQITIGATISANGATVTETTITVPNAKGQTLPETGGMGTTLFYTVGGIMVLAAVVLLITKKRMAVK